ncbi:aldo/keto reductase [Anaerolentibacter hominis]|uniref:aldo/keto reductase n=1 Tax=Anaerolentibacter hominis TaxID=3079009 RepID=UPI0031B89181
MRYQKLGSTGLSVSEITMGTWQSGGQDWGDTSADSYFDAMNAMLENGVNFFDTAPTYGFGQSEINVGKFIHDKRDKVILQTKCGVYWPSRDKAAAGSIKDSSRARVLKQCDESLERLDTDYIDIYMIHWPDPNTPAEETADALKELKKAGKILHTGVSNFNIEQLEAFYKEGVLEVAQYGYSMVDRKAEAQLKWCHEHGVGTMSYGTLGAGILTGKYRTNPGYTSADARGRFYKFFYEPDFSKVMELLKVMDEISGETGMPLAHIAINWNLKKEFMDTVLCGVRNVKQADQNCDATKYTLTDEQVKRLDDKIAELKIMEE